MEEAPGAAADPGSRYPALAHSLPPSLFCGGWAGAFQERDTEPGHSLFAHLIFHPTLSLLISLARNKKCPPSDPRRRPPLSLSLLPRSLQAAAIRAPPPVLKRVIAASSSPTRLRPLQSAHRCAACFLVVLQKSGRARRRRRRHAIMTVDAGTRSRLPGHQHYM